MRNVFLFLWRHNFTLLFVLLEVVAFVLIFSTNNYHSTTFGVFATKTSGNFYSIVNNSKEYLTLKEENDLLAAENERLLNNQLSSYVSQFADTQNIDDTLFLQKYQFMSAKVINNTINLRNNFLILDKGKKHGIEKDMGVVNASGVVGIVKDVSDNFCSVVSLLHKETRISSQIKGTGFFGIIVWEGFDPNYATLSDIPALLKINIGDTIETRESSTIFPTGITIGIIESFDTSNDGNFYTIKVKLSTRFADLTHVYIVKNLLKQEQLMLESAITQPNE